MALLFLGQPARVSLSLPRPARQGRPQDLRPGLRPGPGQGQQSRALSIRRQGGAVLLPGHSMGRPVEFRRCPAANRPFGPAQGPAPEPDEDRSHLSLRAHPRSSLPAARVRDQPKRATATRTITFSTPRPGSSPNPERLPMPWPGTTVQPTERPVASTLRHLSTPVESAGAARLAEQSLQSTTPGRA